MSVFDIDRCNQFLSGLEALPSSYQKLLWVLFSDHAEAYYDGVKYRTHQDFQNSHACLYLKHGSILVSMTAYHYIEDLVKEWKRLNWTNRQWILFALANTFNNKAMDSATKACKIARRKEGSQW